MYRSLESLYVLYDSCVGWILTCHQNLFKECPSVVRTGHFMVHSILIQITHNIPNSAHYNYTFCYMSLVMCMLYACNLVAKEDMHDNEL